MCERNPLHCIIPPDMLERIARKGTPGQREWALRNLHEAAQFRGFRMAASRSAIPFATGEKQRAVHDAAGRYDLPGRLSRAEGAGATGDREVDEAYDGLGQTYDFLHEVFGRDSLDDRGFRLVATVHYAERHANAFWDGRQMVFGDGDGEIFYPFTRSLDVIAHELAHGVVEHTADLAYWEQPGALNESFADVFGSLVKQWALDQTAEQADWLLGAELIALEGQAIRSLKAPGTAHDHSLLGRDRQPKHMKKFVNTNADNGGVHLNSGIPNHAFYLAATRMGGKAWERAGQIWYLALTRSLHRHATFQDAANATHALAGQAYGPDGEEQRAVFSAWRDVGLQPQVQPLKIFVPAREPGMMAPA